ncbi:MAG: methionyl-tRNA formyltransferase [Solobacterium sp.]|nr:methionyl-tRNA formyltransferase [Solobacterium sp.]
MESINVVFFGTTSFSTAVFSTLLEEGYQVIAAVCQPDKPVGRKHTLQEPPVKQFAKEHGIPVYQPVKLSAEAETVLNLKPDLIVTCAYGQLIPVSILNAPEYGCLNIHPSPLPKYRGGAPIQRAVMNGDTSTEVCLMEMAERMDSGRVYARIPATIGEDETASELFDQLEEPARQLIREYLPSYLKGELPGEVQDESNVVIAPNIKREEEQVHFQNEPLPQLYNHLRGLLDEPMGYGLLEGKRVKFARVRKLETNQEQPAGTILGFADHAMRIAAEGGILLVYELQMEGKSRMTADAFYNGSGRNLIGKRFD